jgi:hypothetical protein
VLIRNSVATNVRMDFSDSENTRERGLLAIVESTFDPPLVFSKDRQPELVTPDKEGRCADQFFPKAPYERAICSDYATCIKLKDGVSVSCKCDSSKNDPNDAGRFCPVPPKVTAQAVSSNLRLRIRKPGRSDAGLKLRVELRQDFNQHPDSSVSLQIDSTWHAMRQSGVVKTQKSVSGASFASVFGTTINWDHMGCATPNSLERADALRFDGCSRNGDTFEREIEFAVHLRCNSSMKQMDCPSDGDKLDHVVILNSTMVGTRMTVVVDVEAIPSCKLSTAKLPREPDGASESAAHVTDSLLTAALRNQAVFPHTTDDLTLLIFVYDVDQLPIEHSVPDLTVFWGPLVGKRNRLAYQRSELGAHIFKASVPQEWRSNAGSYLLSAHIDQGWDEQTADVSDCIIAELPVLIRCSEGYEEAGQSGQCIESSASSTLRIVEIACPILAVLVVLLVGLRCWYLNSETTLARRLADERAKMLAQLRARWASKGTLGLSNETNAYGDFPIHCVAAGCPPLGLLNELLNDFPEGARSPDRFGNLPLHLMVQSLRGSKEPAESVYPVFGALLAAYPKAAITPGEHQKLPIELLLESTYFSTEKVRLYVLLGFPLSVDGFADNWCGLLMHPFENSDGEAAVEAIIQEAKRNRGITIEQLAYAKDSLDRQAYAVATKSKRRYLNKHLLLLGRSATYPLVIMWRLLL